MRKGGVNHAKQNEYLWQHFSSSGERRREIDAEKGGIGSLLGGSAGCGSLSRRSRVGTSDPEGVMDQEQSFLAAVASAASYWIAGERLELLDGTDGRI
jgi:hypothetical protein